MAEQGNPLRTHWTLDPGVRFLNHGSFGACPRSVLAEQAEWRARMEREPVRFLAREIEARLDEVRGTLAPFLGAEAEDLVFVPNATTAVNAVLRSMMLAPGDEIVVTDHGYNACSNASRFVCERSGARTVVARVPFPIASPDEVVAAVLEEVNARTKLVLIDHVTSPTALVLPVARLVPELRERGIETLVDGAHAPGMVPLELGEMGAGYYTGNCHKWLCTPKGSAFLHVRRDLQAGVRPTVISHGANSPRNDRSLYRQEFDWMGTVDPSAILCIPAGLRFLGELLPGGWSELMQRNRALALAGRKLLLDAFDLEAPAPAEMIGAIASVPLPDGESTVVPSAFDIDPLQRTLYEEHHIEVPIVPFPAPPKRLVRISAQVYNELDEYRALTAALRELL